MPGTITTKVSQCLLDIAIQGCGSVEAAFAVAQLNGDMAITVDLGKGIEMSLPEIIDKEVVKFYESNGIVPSSKKYIVPGSEGIGNEVIELPGDTFTIE